MSICATVAGCKSLIWDAHNWNTDICNRFVICCIVTAGFRKWQLSTCKCCLTLCHLCQQWSKLRAIVSFGAPRPQAQYTVGKDHHREALWTEWGTKDVRWPFCTDQHYCSQNVIMKLSSNSMQMHSFRKQQNGACFPLPGASYLRPAIIWT